MDDRQVPAASDAEPSRSPDARRLPGGGHALVGAGVLLATINLVLTPQLDFTLPFPDLAGSPTFLLRQLLASLTALLVLYGATGLFLRHMDTAGPLGVIAFGLAFFGSALLLPLEWGQAFIVHDLARVAPEALEAIENQTGGNLFDLGAMIPAAAFGVGWIVFCIWLLRTAPVPRTGPMLVIGGLLTLLVLTGLLGPIWGQIPGSLAVSAGWIQLGRSIGAVPG